MNKLLTFLLLAGTLPALAQKAANPVPYAKTITPADLRKHLFVVASAEMQGRETATEGQRKAAGYIEAQFRQIGLQPGFNGSYQFPYPVYQDTITYVNLEVNGVKFQYDKDFNVNVSNYPATQGFSEVVVIGENVPVDSIKKANLTGRLLLVMPEQQQQNRGRRFQMTPRMLALRDAHPAVVMTVTGGYPRERETSRKGPQMLSLFRPALAAQQVTVSENLARTIIGNDNIKSMQTIKSYKANVLLDMMKMTNTLYSSNVVGVLPGTDLKDEYLFITAHYDHLGQRDSVIYYGADDDGSGTVGVLEIAQAFAAAKAKGHGPRRTIVFMTVSGEEKGLWGSNYYSMNPIFPLEKTTADLNIDMIGRSDATRKPDTLNYVYVVGDDKLSSELKPISEAVNKKYTKLQLDYKFNDPSDPNRIYYRSDHYNFAKNGVPIIFYYDGMLGADYHRPTDTPDKINYDLLAKRAQLVFYTAWEMANRNEMLKRDIPLDQSVFNR